MRPFSKAIAWLCLLLTVGSAAAVVAHHHEHGAESPKCMICVAAHSAAPTTHAPLPVTTFIAVSVVPKVRAIAAKQRLVIFALAVRPPPQL